MKTKTSLWLGVCTLVLCLGVMTFGVYSAINAQLNIGGSLGFNMHNATVSVSGTIKNVAETDDNWASATPVTKTIEQTVMGGESTTINNINLDPLYFYAKENMIFEFTFTNISSKAIDATIPMPTVGGTAVTVLTGTDYTTFTDGVYTTSIASGASTTVSFALQLTDETALTNTVNFSWTNITFEEAGFKLDMIKTGTVANTNDSDNGKTYYYIEMGTNRYSTSSETAKLRWVPIAKYNTTTKEYEKHSKTTAITEPGTYYFISEYILDLPADVTGTSYVGISYGYYASSDTSTAVVYNNGTPSTLTGIKPNDYSVSNIRSYLNGGEAYKTCDSSNQYYAITADTDTYTNVMTGSNAFATYFGLTNDEVYNKYITPRHVSGAKDGATFSLYSDISVTSTSTTVRPTDADSFISSTKASATDADKLWIPSVFEISNYIGTTAALRKASRLTTQGASSQTTGNWWLRSPFFSFPYYAYGVLSTGNLGNRHVCYSDHGARPAFQIQIP